MRSNASSTLLILAALSIGCSQNTPPSIPAAADRETKLSSNANHAVSSGTIAEPTLFESVPVQSAELTGVWYGTTKQTGVVIQFIGRQSREPDTRGVLSGNWVVHVDRGAISSEIEFVDNPQSGAVDLEVGMYNNETKELFTASLGRIERSGNGDLYLSIEENTASDMYVPVRRIRLKCVNDATEINRAIIDQMKLARATLQAA